MQNLVSGSELTTSHRFTAKFKIKNMNLNNLRILKNLVKNLRKKFDFIT